MFRRDDTQHGIDLTISLTHAQAATLGDDAAHLIETLSTALVGMVAMRNRDAVGTATLTASMATEGGDDWDAMLIAALADLRIRLGGVQDAAIRAHAAHGGSYGALGNALGTVRGTAQRRRDSLLDAAPAAPELWATGTHADVDHVGVRVPDTLRSWSTPWPGYTPADITPEELRAGTIDTTATWISDYQTDPTQIDNIHDRQAAALLPFDIDDCGRPLNPTGRTGRAGRNLGRWAENCAADPIVIAGHGQDRRVLLIRRSDVGQWAIPGGMVDPGETATAAATRELAEETGVDLADLTPTILGRRYVDDWRSTDHAWVVTTAALYTLDDTVEATAADDADDAAWFPATDIDTLTAAITKAGGELYPAHRDLLTTALAKTA